MTHNGEMKQKVNETAAEMFQFHPGTDPPPSALNSEQLWESALRTTPCAFLINFVAKLPKF